MSNSEFIQLLPDSVFRVDADSNNYKRWSLFAEQMDELDLVFDDLSTLSDYPTHNGAVLDVMGKLLRERRQGRADSEYVKFLYIALRKYLSTGSIPDLITICDLLLGEDFLYIRDLNFGSGDNDLMLDGSWFLDGEHYLSGDDGNPDISWLDGLWFLDGDRFLSGDIYQAALFEVVVRSGIAIEDMLTLEEVVRSCRGAGIKPIIRESEE